MDQDRRVDETGVILDSGSTGGQRTDQAVVVRSEELDALYEQGSASLLLLAYGLTDDLAEARQCATDAWVQVLARPRVLDEVADPAGYLRQVVAARIRSRRRRRALPGRLRPRPAPATGPVPEELDRLPVELRQAIVLRDLAGLGLGEAAALAGVAPAELRQRVAAGREALAAGDHAADTHPGPPTDVDRG